jgi:transcriptional regulator with XRE-family HTH domain
MTFAQRLRQLRDNAGLSEAKLAKASGVPFATLHDYGGGRRMPSFSNVVKIAAALGATCEAFADCEDIAPMQANGSAEAGSKKPARRKPKAK